MNTLSSVLATARRGLRLSALVLIGLGSCSDEPALPELKGAPILFEATARGTYFYVCDNGRWRLKDKEQEVLFDKAGQRIGTAANDIYTTQWKGDDGAAASGRLTAREKTDTPDDPPVFIYSVVQKSAGQFAQAVTVRRSRPRGDGLSVRECRDAHAERKVAYSLTYTFYGAGASR